MKQPVTAVGALIALALLFAVPAGSSVRPISESEHLSVPADGARTLRLRDIDFTEFTYSGAPGRTSLSISFTKTVETGDRSEFEDIAAELDLEILSDGDALTIRLIHPKQKAGNLLRGVFDRREWKTAIEISGPEMLDIEFDGGFSQCRFSGTSGILDIDADFSKTTVSDLRGRLQADMEFGSLRALGIAGSFDIDAGFGDVDLTLSGLTQDSRLKTSFGSGKIVLPPETGAAFMTDSSMGGISFRTHGRMEYDGNMRILNGGGSLIRLSADFGEITVRDDAHMHAGTSGEGLRGVVVPLSRETWWRFEGNGRSNTLRVMETTDESGHMVARLAWDDGERAPFGEMALTESDEGLMVYSITGGFFGREITGEHRFVPPRLWLPYGEGKTIENEGILGTFRAVSRENISTPAGDFRDAWRYEIPSGSGSITVVLAPGVGFTSIGDMRLADYAIGGVPRERYESRLPKPRFTEGALTSVEFRGLRLVSEDEVHGMLELSVGETYTREEIADAVKRLEDHRYITSTSFTIDVEGRLRVHVYEPKIHTRDLGLSASFSRIGGVGLGPTITVTSLIGPVSEIRGGTEYHWANEEWTYYAGAEKRFFENVIAIGGAYRLGWESAMDWTIPRNDMYLNAFLAGLETNDFHEVEGATGYVRVKPAHGLVFTGEYFEEEFRSLKKHTNWSLFNHRHTKDDNASLSPADEGRLAGLRATLTFERESRYTTTAVRVSLEKALDRSDTVGEYNKLTGSFTSGWNFLSDNYLKIRLAGGYSGDPLPGQKAFRLGGLNTLRGYDYESVPGGLPLPFQYGGTRMALMNLEYYMGDNDDFGLIFFADAGNVWMHGQEATFDSIRRDVGVGLLLGSGFFGNPASLDIFGFGDVGSYGETDGLRVNWAVPVGNVPHVSNWTINFVRGF